MRVHEILDHDATVLLEGFDEELEGLGAVDFADAVGAFGGEVDWFGVVGGVAGFAETGV